MLLPKPKTNEKKENFIDRVMTDAEMKEEFPDDIQRYAITENQWNNKDKKSWYEIIAKSDEADIYIYEEIGLWGIGAKDFITELKEIKANKINLHVNSPGGSVFDGTAIYNALKNHKAEIITYIDGLAASMASVIALAGNTVNMAENALFMIHNPSGCACGDAEDMRKTAEILDKIKLTIIVPYENRYKGEDKTIETLMDEETWLTAAEAEELGFIDNITGKVEIKNKFEDNMKHLGFKSIPKNNTEEPPNVPSSTKEEEKTSPSIGMEEIKMEDEALKQIYKIGGNNNEQV